LLILFNYFYTRVVILKSNNNFKAYNYNETMST